ncbi:MAG: hypothetical protein AAF092_06760 [Pseudomonadota bacterium]
MVNEPQTPVVDASVLGDVDAWDLRRAGDWYRFHARLPGDQGARMFRRRVAVPRDASAPDIIADPTGALYGVLSLGGARRAGTSDEALRFPYHVVTAGDEFGPAGSVGTEAPVATELMQRVWEQSRDTLLADALVAQRFADWRALPVIYARGEADSSATMAEFTEGAAMAQLAQTVANFVAAAGSLGLPPKVLCVGLDFVAEDVSGDAEAWRAGMIAVMDNVTALFARHGLRKPLFTTLFDAGSGTQPDGPVLRAQWELAWNCGAHDLLVTAPGYMFAQDRFGRLTGDARAQLAEMEACAVEAANADAGWACPLFLLAEVEGDGKTIRCKAQCTGPLVVDGDDPLGAGAAAGFRLEGTRNGARVTGVTVARDDPQDLLLTCDKPPKGRAVTLLYALGQDGGNRGAVRDGWARASRTGATLRRWALPAALPVH